MEVWFLIWERDFYIWQDVLLAAYEECDQTRDWAVPFFTHCVVVWFAAVVDQLQAPWVGISSPRIAVDT